MHRSLLRLGALAAWREEIRAGKRHNTSADFDNLAAAACHELHAYELEQRGHKREAVVAMDTALLRLHGCYGRPDDGTPNTPGPGSRLLRQLLAERDARSG